MLPALVFLALAAFAGALLGSPGAGRPALLHLMLAVGAMPLIFGAMGHFIPVLTRTREAAAPVAALPVVALAGGVMAVGAFSFSRLAWGWRAGALLALAAAIGLLVWSYKRRKAMVGRPHPGLAWYEAALACLGLALFAILAATFWPQQFAVLRRFHLHLNTLGFIGMTALGTLAVLMPTVSGRPDPDAGPWLRHAFRWAVAGTLLVATGSAWFGPLAWIGGLLWAILLARLGTRWLRLYRREIFATHGAAPLLAAALAGFVLSLLAGAVSAAAAARGWQQPDPEAVFVSGFLLPLVSGATSQLLPVWLRPGVQGAWHAELRRNLGRYGGLRATLFAAGGLAAGLGRGWGLLLGAATLIWFLLQALIALSRANFAQRDRKT